MSALDPAVADVLDRLAPRTARTDDWERVVADALPYGGGALCRRRRTLARLGLVATLVAVAAGVAVAWPFESEKLTVLDRALAAVGNGPVVHLVLRDEWGATLVDLESGKRRRLHGEREIWFDPTRGLHEVGRFGGVRQSDALYPAGKLPDFLERTVAGIASGYRNALRTGKARVLEEGVVDGVSVYWIRVHAELLPDVADGKLHEWAHDVAVSRESYEPIYLRETRDGEPGPQTGTRVLAMQTLPEGAGDFSVQRGADKTQMLKFGFGRQLEMGEARTLMGTTAVWGGERLEGLPLTGMSELRLGVAEAVERRVSCSELTLAPSRTNERRESCRGDVVRVTGGASWEETIGVALFYGARPAEPRHAPLAYREPHVLIQQTLRPHPALRSGVGNYRPPEGKVVLAEGGSATLQMAGLHLVIQASSEELALAAAHALRPIPAR